MKSTRPSSRRLPTISERAVTVGESLAAARARLGASQSARFDAALLLATTLGTDTAWLLAHDRDALRAEVLERYRTAIERRAAGEPVPYITGVAGFYGRTFTLTPDVLVPRPESEQLVTLALARVAPLQHRPRICDVGTGSGILAITLALESPGAVVSAIDVSAAALRVAARNAAALGVADRIAFVHGEIPGALASERAFDAIVANLPYVRSGDLAAAPDPTGYEPRLALDGGVDGLEAYRRCLVHAPRWVAADGALFMEAGSDTASSLAALAMAAFPEARVSVHRDLAGLERIVEVSRASR